MRFEGKAVLITGGATGIGRATALAFAREGAVVMIGDVDARAAKLHSKWRMLPTHRQ
jgi:NAD(P)-dependent dehydrogenase (short-subunit alcohol dehydrogenase family)